MSILSRIVSKLSDIVHRVVDAVREKVEETHEHEIERREERDERRAASLAEELDKLAKDSPYKNWRISVEDLTFLVGEDGSYAGRKELWSDLEMDGKYEGFAAQNIALHARLLAELPTHGIPLSKPEQA